MKYTPHFVIDDRDERINITSHAGRMQVVGQLVDHFEKRMSQRVSLLGGKPAVVERIVRHFEGDGAHSSAALAKEMRRVNSVAP